ncbi:MAG TPA: hypothetical protein VHO48_12335 [Anaerolineaceae bacterium]|nr:hypothetical protein [Anaerolineaceae bacterium]
MSLSKSFLGILFHGASLGAAALVRKKSSTKHLGVKNPSFSFVDPISAHVENPSKGDPEKIKAGMT